MTDSSLSRRSMLIGGVSLAASSVSAFTLGATDAMPPAGQLTTALQGLGPSALVGFRAAGAGTSSIVSSTATSLPAPATGETEPCPFDGGSTGLRILPGGDALTVAQQPVTQPGGLTAVVTFRLADTSGAVTLVANAQVAVTLQQSTDSTPGMTLALQSAGRTTATSAATIRDVHTWHVLVWTASTTSGSSRLFLDGAPVTLTVADGSAAVEPGGAMRFGSSFGIDGGGVSLGQLAVYPRTLSADEAGEVWAARQTRYASTDIRLGVMSNLADYTVGDQSWRVEGVRGLFAAADRITVRWDTVQPGPGQYAWQQVDTALQHIRDARQEPVVCITNSAPWAAREADPSLKDVSDPTRVPTGAALQAWIARSVEFVREVVARYAEDTGSMPCVRKWELWNEPNSTEFWKSGGSGAASSADYIAWYTAVHAAVREVSPAAQIAIGAISSVNYVGAGAVPGVRWLGDLVEAGVPIEHVNVHLYGGDGANDPTVHVPFQPNFDDLWSLQDRLRVLARTPGYEHLTTVPIWITEYGWNAAAIGEAKQAQYLQEALRMLTDYSGGQVALTTYFLALDIEALQYGLFAAVGRTAMPRRSAGVFRAAARTTSGRVQVPSVNAVLQVQQ